MFCKKYPTMGWGLPTVGSKIIELVSLFSSRITSHNSCHPHIHVRSVQMLFNMFTGPISFIYMSCTSIPKILTGGVIGSLTPVSVYRGGQIVRSCSLVYRRRLAGGSLWCPTRYVPPARWSV